MDEKSTELVEKTDESEVTYETFEDLLNTFDEPAKALYESHTAGLKSALDTERKERKALAEQLKELSGKAEKGSEMEAKLAETAQKLEQTERRAKFAEESSAEGCVNPKAGWTLASAEELFTEAGDIDWRKLKGIAPELFKVAPATNAGIKSKPAAIDFNEEIRRKAGIIK